MELRVARHTNRIEEIIDFYTNILGLEILGNFENHNNYNGVFIGKQNKDWHLEFTTTSEEVYHFPDEDDCLVFYPKTNLEYDEIKSQLNSFKIEAIEPKNPYWKNNGISIKDPDGFFVIISHIKIKS